MTVKLHSNTPNVPSSLLHSSQDVRAEYTRVAARKVTANVRKNLSQMMRGMRSKPLGSHQSAV
ncbi:hypothetical protein [Marinobacter salicampi]|uniref:hypothetical protein n=1 Tax=Marinobacter salicampi TaxID=435907 RepID=UPI001407A38D|nr:hypothetical protein [Marinobacter salicampi]